MAISVFNREIDRGGRGSESFGLNTGNRTVPDIFVCASFLGGGTHLG